MRTKDIWPKKEDSQQEGYEEIISKIEKIIDNPEEIKSFITKRLMELKNNSSKVEIGGMSRQWHSGFIHPGSTIRRNYMVDPFHVDDDSVYEEMFSIIREFKSYPTWKEKTLKQMMPSIVNHTIGKYFGNYVTYSDTEQKNQNFYLSHDDPTLPDVSLRELKDKSMAVCAEKSALAQNLTSFLGLESFLVISDSCKANPDDKNGLHAYNIWKSKNGYFIFDPTNPHLSLEKDTNKLLNYFPSVYPISEESFNTIKNGGIVDVIHEDIISDIANNSSEKKMTKRTYGGPNVSK